MFIYILNREEMRENGEEYNKGKKKNDPPTKIVKVTYNSFLFIFNFFNQARYEFKIHM